MKKIRRKIQNFVLQWDSNPRFLSFKLFTLNFLRRNYPKIGRKIREIQFCSKFFKLKNFKISKKSERESQYILLLNKV